MSKIIKKLSLLIIIIHIDGTKVEEKVCQLLQDEVIKSKAKCVK